MFVIFVKWMPKCICKWVRKCYSSNNKSAQVCDIACVCLYILINFVKILFFLSQALNVTRLSKACNLGIGAPCGGDMMNIFFFSFFFLKINISGAIDL